MAAKNEDKMNVDSFEDGLVASIEKITEILKSHYNQHTNHLVELMTLRRAIGVLFILQILIGICVISMAIYLVTMK